MVPLEICDTVLGQFVTLSPWEGRPITDTMRAIVEDVPRDRAGLIPGALSLLIPALLQDQQRRLVTLQMVTTFDLYEVADALARLPVSEFDAEVALVAADIIASPGVEVGTYDRLRSTIESLELPEAQRRALDIRLNPDAPVFDELDSILRAQRWPGSDEYQRRPLAVVAVVESGSRPHDLWKLSAILARLGFIIRRVPSQYLRQPSPEWLGPAVPRLAWQLPASPEEAARTILIDEGVEAAPLAKRIHEINQLLPEAARVRPPPESLADVPSGGTPREDDLRTAIDRQRAAFGHQISGYKDFTRWVRTAPSREQALARAKEVAGDDDVLLHELHRIVQSVHRTSA